MAVHGVSRVAVVQVLVVQAERVSLTPQSVHNKNIQTGRLSSFGAVIQECDCGVYLSTLICLAFFYVSFIVDHENKVHTCRYR